MKTLDSDLVEPASAGFDELMPKTLRPGRLGQPDVDAVADGQETPAPPRPDHILPRLLGRWPAEMIIVDPQADRGGPSVTDDLDRTACLVVHDDHSFGGADPVYSNPDSLTQQLLRHRVLAVLEGDHRCVRRHPAGQPEHHRVRLVRHPVQPGAFLGQHLGRDPPGHPMRPPVHGVGELRARLLQLSEVTVGVAEVCTRWASDQPWRSSLSLDAAPRRVRRLASQYRYPVMPAERDRFPGSGPAPLHGQP
jgi:hypothetical protein